VPEEEAAASAGSGAATGSGDGSGAGSGAAAGSGSEEVSQPATSGATENPVPDGDGSGSGIDEMNGLGDVPDDPEGSARNDLINNNNSQVASSGLMTVSDGTLALNSARTIDVGKVVARRQDILSVDINDDLQLSTLGSSSGANESTIISADIKKDQIKNLIVKRTVQEQQENQKRIKEDIRRRETEQKRRNAIIRGSGNGNA
jgi:hypothetical protein